MRDPPSGRVPEQGPDWFLVAIEACGGGTAGLGLFLGVSIFIGIFGVGNKSGGSTRRRQDRGRSLHPCGGLMALLAQLFYSMVFFWSKNKLRQVSGQLDSVWFSFSAILKNKEKTETGTGL